MNTPSKIVIIGATGMVGTPVTDALVERGFEVTIITRTPDQALAKFPKCHIQFGDLRDPESILRLITGHDALHLNLSIDPTTRPWHFITERDGVAVAIQCAKLAGISRISYVSSLVQRLQGTNGFDWWVFRVKQAAVDAIKASGIPHTIFYPTTFMENIDSGFMIQGQRIIVPAVQQRGSYYIAGRDFGGQVAKSYEVDLPDSAEFVVQGPERLLPIVAARHFAAHYPHDKLIPTRVPMWPLKMASMLSRRMEYFDRALTALGRFDEPFLAEPTWKRLGVPQITMSDYARFHSPLRP